MNIHRISILALIIASIFSQISAQLSPNHYMVNFTDKNNSKYSIDKPEEFLSQRALERRQKANISLSENDLPVSQFYLDSLEGLGLKIVNISKWLNAACVYTLDTILMKRLDRLTFVRSVGIDKNSNKNALDTTIKKAPVKQYGVQEVDSNYIQSYGGSFAQIQIHNGHLLHKEGYMGQGMHIAVLDAGFYKVNELAAFDSLRENNQILGTRDFVDGDYEVYDADSHGMKVLSTMAGNIPGGLLGTAPKASYWLLRSEQAATEYIIEEFNWVSAAEFADSVGVDLINSSLGYSDFDDNAHDHTYADLDGNTTIITKAADIAASKGILVVTSAGNEGASMWRYISAPGDADSILTVGAIMPDSRRAYFSSLGPSADKRIKPDVCAIGLPSIVSGTGGEVSSSSGTSFSSPIMAGLVACLWQAHPELTNMEVIDIIKRSSSQFNAPDTSLGYGIPDVYAAHIFLKTSGFIDIKKGNMRVFPNPFNENLNIEYFNEDITIPYNLRIELFDLFGKQLMNQFYSEVKNNYKLSSFYQLQNINTGMYILRLTADNMTMERKILKF